MTSRRDPASKQSAYESKFDLGALFEFSTIINSSLDLKFILSHFLLTIMGKLLSLRGMILLEEGNHLFRVELAKGVPQSILDKTLAMKRFPNKLMYLDRVDARRYPWLGFFRENGIRLLVPLVVGDKTLGVAGFAPSAIKKRLRRTETTYIKSLANIAASAVAKGLVFSELQQSNRELSRKIQEVNTLFELSKEFNSILDSERLVKLLMFSLMGQVGVKRYFICLRNEGEARIAGQRLDKEIDKRLFEFFPSLKAPTLVSGLSKKSEEGPRAMLQEIGIQVLVPLRVQNETKGIFGLGEKIQGGHYEQSDLEFLSSLGNLAIISLENARLFHETIEKQRLEDELLIAKEIQRGLLPASLPAVPNVDMAATNISSRQVGGDYYDVIRLPDDRFVIAIGDVSGKGTPASLLMANLQATIRALVPLGLPLSELTTRVNDLLCENTGYDRFITFFWGILDTRRSTLNYVSAGHNPPFLFRKSGKVERLEKGGLILGIMKTAAPYEEGIVHLEPDDVLLMFTDGVSEAMNLKGEEWGEDSLAAVAQDLLRHSSHAMLTRIVEGVRAHSKHVPQSDDITLVILKMLRPQS